MNIHEAPEDKENFIIFFTNFLPTSTKVTGNNGYVIGVFEYF